MRPQTNKSIVRRGGTRGFSLAELMIALGVLAMGLLVIGAALPVGIQYARETINQATGESTVQYALDLIEAQIAVYQTVGDPARRLLIKFPTIFYPRYDEPNAPANSLGAVVENHEPMGKVRVLPTENVILSLTNQYGQIVNWQGYGFTPERAIFQWLKGVGATFPIDERECDVFRPHELGLPLLPQADSYWLKPGIASVSTVYPPISPDLPFYPSSFQLHSRTPDPNQYMQFPVSVPQNGGGGWESRKAAERRTVWTAFYRRVSYRRPGSDPYLYEVITVAVRLPGPAYRFPEQDTTGWVAGGLRATNNDFLAPIPWMAKFMAFNTLPPPNVSSTPPAEYERWILEPFVPPPTLRWLADAALGAMLPKGSIFIPAVNDLAPTNLQPDPNDPNSRVQVAGFLPSAPDTLPIFEVVDRVYNPPNNTYEIVTRYNGYYPWVRPGLPGRPMDWWPIWVIPPACTRDPSTNQPIFADDTQIVGIGRRYIRLREVP